MPMQMCSRNSELPARGEAADSYPFYIQLNLIYDPKSPLIVFFKTSLPKQRSILQVRKQIETLDRFAPGGAVKNLSRAPGKTKV